MDLFDGEFILISLGTTIAGFILYAITSAAVKAPGALLNTKFANLGVLQGKTFAEISSAVGTPNSVSATVGENGEKITIRQWISTGYHIVLLFDENDVCLGISSETSV